jgi:hypothetical protein
LLKDGRFQHSLPPIPNSRRVCRGYAIGASFAVGARIIRFQKRPSHSNYNLPADCRRDQHANYRANFFVPDERAYPPADQYQWKESQIDCPSLPTFMYLPINAPRSGALFGYRKIGQLWKALI